jgi:asparagine synthase (glutamine-hydrolysing)
MCGIGGTLDRLGRRAPDIAALRRMAGAIVHRGPDELGIYRDDQVGLVHTRLSIIDLASGQQPLSNEDGTLWIVFNGEIFNYVELREELSKLGHTFRTQSDTEVIVHAFESWGEDAFDRFNGQWAIALWDSRRRRLVLARDRFGVRPLHYAEIDGRLTFASEAKSIFAAEPALSRDFDPAGIDEAFTFWAPIAPRTPFAAVRELPPGHLMVVDAGTICVRPYWEMSFPTHPDEQFRGSVEEAAEAVRAALEEATRLRVLRADVPVGSYLSGGLDSSLVAALAIGRRAGRLSTFSLRFEDAEYDETTFQRTMVTRLESDHHEIVVRRADIANAFPRVVAHTERPLLRTAPAPLFLLSGLVRREGIKVVLTGEGADEMFAGYDVFREAKVRRFWARAPRSKSRPLLLDRLYPYLARSPVSQRAMAQKFFGRRLEDHDKPGFAQEPRWHSAAALKRLFSSEMRAAIAGSDRAAELLASLPSAFREWTALAQDQHLEIRTILSSYILCSQGDRMLMAHSVEGRFPFLDVNVAKLASTLPPSYKLRVLDEKHVLKRAAEGLVPQEILRRPKQPYRAPDALSFVADGAGDWIDEALAKDEIDRAGVFDPGMVEALWSKVRARRDDAQMSNADNMALVGILSTQLLHRHVLRADPRSGEELHFATIVDRSTATTDATNSERR